MPTRRELLEKHNNNYGFDVHDILSAPLGAQPPAVSIVIPYYETGENFSRCLYFLEKAVGKYPSKSEIIVVDDGSVKKPLTNYINGSKTITAIILEDNRGRTEARNVGLSAAKGEIVIFLDSDVLIDEDLIINHTKLHTETLQRNIKAICVSFFEFTDAKSEKITKDRLKNSDVDINDFRIDCTYGATWAGCEADKQYIGQHIRLVDETQQFRDWRGQYKAWMLPNMILGGAFSVVREEISAVGAFDPRFTGYGFTETSAVTRMVAERSNVVVPCLLGGAIHVEDEDVNVPRGKKDEIFKAKHDFYFNTFLKEEIMTKKVLFIDWNKTLSYSLFWEHLRDKEHPNHKHLPVIEKWLFIDNQDVINPWMRGELNVDTIIEQMSRDTGIDSKLILDELRQSCEEMRYSIDSLENVIEQIQACGIKVVIATDNMDTFSRFTVPAMKLDKLFDDVLNSHDIGHLKDDNLPADKILFFDEYLEKNDWTYADAILFDDSPDKNGKYKTLGFDRVIIDSPETLKRELERLADVA